MSQLMASPLHLEICVDIHLCRYFVSCNRVSLLRLCPRSLKAACWNPIALSSSGKVTARTDGSENSGTSFSSVRGSEGVEVRKQKAVPQPSEPSSHSTTFPNFIKPGVRSWNIKRLPFFRIDVVQTKSWELVGCRQLSAWPWLTPCWSDHDFLILQFCLFL